MIRSTLKRGLKKAIKTARGDTARPADVNHAWQAETAPAPAPVVQAKAEPVVEAKAEPVVEAAPEAAVEAAPEAAVEAAPEAKAPVVFDDDDDTVGMPLTLDNVQEILDDMVRPALQGDGGDIALVKIEDNNVYVKLVGACDTCPSATATMKLGVEALFREEFPDMRELIQVD
jgi:Fe-S cluster biogenesis protein NfuA